MKIEIISTECIKPSSPTPNDKRVFKLSFLDNSFFSFYNPTVFYYTTDQNPPPANPKDISTEFEKLQRLKQSLSQSLSRYYPLAGKINDDLSIECTDEGAFYVETRINCNLSDFVNQPDLTLLHEFLPCEPNYNESTVGAHATMVQVNMFLCGGMAICVFVSHLVVDGIGSTAFIKDWAAIARGSCGDDGAIALSTPDLTAPSLFPQKGGLTKDMSIMALWSPFCKKGKSVTRRFVFDAKALTALKAIALNSMVQYPSRVQVVIALIWKRAMAAFKTKSGVEKPSLITLAMGLRQKTTPPFSECSIGNFVWTAVAKCAAAKKEEAAASLGDLAIELRKGMAKIDGEFLKKMEGDEGEDKFLEGLKEMGRDFSDAALSIEGVDFIGFASGCSFGLYEVDFGWGKPVWTTSAKSRYEGSSVLNFVLLMATRGGDGIEAWVTLDEHDMAILQADQELLAFASLDPNPLQK